MMTDAGQLIASIASAWPRTRPEASPFRHWLLRQALPHDVAQDIAALPVPAPEIDDTQGRRETHNATRWFFSRENQECFPVCSGMAVAFQNADVVRMLERLTGTGLSGTSLRIEYCQDTDGFWLEPHTDIGAKRFTALVYLSEGPGAEGLGTDIYDDDRRHLGTVPGGFDAGLIFIPGANTWHGFRRRSFAGIRKSIIINYVGPEWRARHELAFPDAPIAAG